MNHVGRNSTIFLIIILLLSTLAMLGLVNAQTPKPSVPKFTAKIGNAEGIEITIKNQPYSYTANGITYNIYYNIRVKPHGLNTWTEVFPTLQRFKTQSNTDYGTYIRAPIQSQSDYTVITYPPEYGDTYSHDSFPTSTEMDIQVQAVVGYESQVWVGDHPLAPQLTGHFESATAYETQGEWSNTLTASSITTTPTPYSPPMIITTPNPLTSPNSKGGTAQVTSSPQPQTTISPSTGTPNTYSSGFDWQTVAIGVLAILVAGLTVGMVVLYRKIGTQKVN